MNGTRLATNSLRVAALLIAAGIWLIASAQRRERTLERTYDVPVALVAIPRELIVTSATQNTISVRLRGPASVLRGVTSQDLEATVDLSDAHTGSVDVVIRPQSLNVPDAVEVVSISPERFRLTLEPVRQKQVPIRPFFVGQPPFGFDLGDPPVVTPEFALVSGPASLIADVNDVTTERIILSGRTTDFRVRVAVVSDSALVRVVDPLNALVDVPIRPEAEIVPDTPAETTTAGEPQPEGNTPTNETTVRNRRNQG